METTQTTPVPAAAGRPQPLDSRDIRVQFKRFSTLAGTSLIVLGCFVFLNWLVRANGLGGIPVRLTVNPMTGVMLIICGLALRLETQANAAALRVGKVCAAATLILALWELGRYFGWNNGVGHLLFHGRSEVGRRIIPITLNASLGFLFAGAALVLLDYETAGGHRPAQFLSIGGLALSLMTLAGYGYGINTLSTAETSVDFLELNAALSFAVLHLGSLCSRPDRGMMALAISTDPGGSSIRHLLPAIVFVPTVLAWARILGQITGLQNEASGSPIFAAASLGIYAALIWWNADLLHKTSLEQALADKKMREAAEMKAEFAAIVSHELRTPLTSIKIGIDMALGTPGEPDAASLEDRDRCLSVAKRSVDRLARLINEVLDFQKLELGRQEFRMLPQDVNAVVAEAVKSLAPAARQQKVRIVEELTDGLPPCVLDKDRISQVVLNLLNNAIKFCPHCRITIRTEARNGFVRVSIRDEGPGIKAEDQARLFRSFSQLHPGGRKVEGSGLGLAISRQIVERHLGRIGVESAEGRGSVFYFLLPAAPKEAS